MNIDRNNPELHIQTSILNDAIEYVVFIDGSGGSFLKSGDTELISAYDAAKVCGDDRLAEHFSKDWERVYYCVTGKEW